MINITANYMYPEKIKANFPGHQLAQMVDAKITELQLISPVLVGDIWLIGNVIAHSDNRYIPFIDNDIEKSPWILDYDVVNNKKLFITNDDKYLSDHAYQKVDEKEISGHIYRLFVGY